MISSVKPSIDDGALATVQSASICPLGSRIPTAAPTDRHQYVGSRHLCRRSARIFPSAAGACRGGHLNQVVCLLAFRLWPAPRCAQGHGLRYRYGRGYLRNIHGTRGRGKPRPATPRPRSSPPARPIAAAVVRGPSTPVADCPVTSAGLAWPGRGCRTVPWHGTARLRDLRCVAAVARQARMLRSPKLQCESGRTARGSSRPRLQAPASGGIPRNLQLDVIDSLQLTANHTVATPVNWVQGEDVIIAGSVSNADAKKIIGEWKEPKPYSASFRNPFDRRPAGTISLTPSRRTLPSAARAPAGSVSAAARAPRARRRLRPQRAAPLRRRLIASVPRR